MTTDGARRVGGSSSSRKQVVQEAAARLANSPSTQEAGSPTPLVLSHSRAVVVDQTIRQVMQAPITTRWVALAAGLPPSQEEQGALHKDAAQ
jgi:hypothetical protein